MSNQLQVSGEAKIRAIQGPVVANSGVITALDGDASEYVRGDGTLADFPTSTGGGSSVSYYLNTSVSQGTIGGVAYKQLSKTPISGAGTDVTISANGYVASYITDSNDPALLEVPAGNFNCEFYFSVNSNSHNPYVYAELYKYDGTTFTLLGSNVAIPQYLTNGTTLSAYYFAIPVATSVLTVTDRISIRIYVNVDGRTVTLHTENNHLCQVVTTFSKGLISLNNLTRQNQFFQTGTSGTDFAISSATATHTFNLPVASATNTGKLSSTDWSTFNGKVPYTGATADVDLGVYNFKANIVSIASAGGSNQLTSFANTNSLHSASAGLNVFGFNTSNNIYFGKGLTGGGLGNGGVLIWSNTQVRYYTLPDADGTLALVGGSGVGTVTSVAALTLGTTGTDLSSTVANSTTTPVITLNVPTASATNRGALSSADWTTFNNKQAALTNPVTGTGTTNTHAKFTSASVIGNSMVSDDGTTLTSAGATRSNLYIKAVNNTYYSQLAFTNGTNGSYGGISYNNSGQYMQFETSSSEWMRLMSDGKLGIGTTSPAYTLDVSGTGYFSGIVGIGVAPSAWYNSSGYATLQVGNASLFGRNSANSELYLSSNAYDNTSGNPTYITTDFAARYVQNDGVHSWLTAPSGTAGTATTFTERMRITQAGNVGIGTTSPTAKLDVNGEIRMTGSTLFRGMSSNTLQLCGGTSSSNVLIDGSVEVISMSTNGGERMRITSGGEVLIGKTTADGAVSAGCEFRASGLGYFSRTNGESLLINRKSSDGTQIQFRRDNVDIGNISSTTSVTSYNVTSDYRLKEDLQEVNGLEKLCKIKVYNYLWKSDKTRMDGVIAHELQEIIPYAVTGKKDDEKMQSVDYSKLVAILVKSVQEQQIQIQNLQEQINILAK